MIYVFIFTLLIKKELVALWSNALSLYIAVISICNGGAA